MKKGLKKFLISAAIIIFTAIVAFVSFFFGNKDFNERVKNFFSRSEQQEQTADASSLLRENLLELEKKLDGLTSDYYIEKENNQLLKNQVENLQAEKSELENLLEQEHEDIEEIQTKIEKISNDLSQISLKVDESIERISELELEISEIKSKISEINFLINEKKTQVKMLELQQNMTVTKRTTIGSTTMDFKGGQLIVVGYLYAKINSHICCVELRIDDSDETYEMTSFDSISDTISRPFVFALEGLEVGTHTFSIEVVGQQGNETITIPRYNRATALFIEI